MSHLNKVIFHAVMHPHCSLKAEHFRWLMGGVGMLYGAVGMYFFMQGAWPIMGFFGLEFLLLYLAFKISFRRARLREEITVTEQEIHLNRSTPAGKENHWCLPSYWARLSLSEPVEPATPLVFRSHGKSIPFARFLSIDEKKSLFQALSRALSRLQ